MAVAHVSANTIVNENVWNRERERHGTAKCAFRYHFRNQTWAQSNQHSSFLDTPAVERPVFKNCDSFHLPRNIRSSLALFVYMQAKQRWMEKYKRTTHTQQEIVEKEKWLSSIERRWNKQNSNERKENKWRKCLYLNICG